MPDADVEKVVKGGDAARVNQWIKDAVGSGARMIVGGDYSGAVHAPTIVADVKPEMRISCEELFGPGGGGNAVHGHRGSHCDGQQHKLWPECWDFHAEH